MDTLDDIAAIEARHGFLKRFSDTYNSIFMTRPHDILIAMTAARTRRRPAPAPLASISQLARRYRAPQGGGSHRASALLRQAA